MLCVRVGRLEMPSAHLSRTMYQQSVSRRVFSILKLQALEAVSSQLGGCFATRMLELAGKSLPALGLLRSDIKMPFVWCHCALI